MSLWLRFFFPLCYCLLRFVNIYWLKLRKIYTTTTTTKIHKLQKITNCYILDIYKKIGKLKASSAQCETSLTLHVLLFYALHTGQKSSCLDYFWICMLLNNHMDSLHVYWCQHSWIYLLPAIHIFACVKSICIYKISINIVIFLT